MNEFVVERRVDEHALAGGYLPEYVPGPSKRQSLVVNPRHYLLRAACAHMRWSLHDRVTAEQFDAAIAAVDDGATR
jgi:hypothetical protein